MATDKLINKIRSILEQSDSTGNPMPNHFTSNMKSINPKYKRVTPKRPVTKSNAKKGTRVRILGPNDSAGFNHDGVIVSVGKSIANATVALIRLDKRTGRGERNISKHLEDLELL